jgi:hypothetical protein
MANRSKIIDLIKTLMDAYPHHKAQSLEGLVNLWTRKFEEIDNDILAEAVDLHIDASTYFPGIHNIREQMATAEYNIINKDNVKIDWSNPGEVVDIKELGPPPIDPDLEKWLTGRVWLAPGVHGILEE